MWIGAGGYAGGYAGGPCLQGRQEARERAVRVEENLILLFTAGKSKSTFKYKDARIFKF